MDNLQLILAHFKRIGIVDIIDIIIVAYLLYKAISLLKDTSAARLAKGIVMVLVLMQVAEWTHLNTISYILQKTVGVGLTAIVVIFAPELRRMLEQFGKGKMVSGLLSPRETETSELEGAIVQITAACENMSWSRTGALIVFERNERLSEIAKNGTAIDAQTTAELVKNIFYPKSPLHDGAMIIREGRIAAAGCVLPLSNTQTLSKDLGTRHRAAVGMSETSDSVLVVVSEETGSISVAIGGMLKRHLAPETLEKVLRSELMPQTSKDKGHGPKKILRKWKGKAK